LSLTGALIKSEDDPIPTLQSSVLGWLLSVSKQKNPGGPRKVEPIISSSGGGRGRGYAELLQGESGRPRKNRKRNRTSCKNPRDRTWAQGPELRRVKNRRRPGQQEAPWAPGPGLCKRIVRESHKAAGRLPLANLDETSRGQEVTGYHLQSLGNNLSGEENTKETDWGGCKPQCPSPQSLTIGKKKKAKKAHLSALPIEPSGDEKTT